MSDGVYRAERRRVQRRKKAAVAVVGMAALFGGGAYGVHAWQTARDVTRPGDTGALAPVVTPSTTRPTTSKSPSASPSATRSEVPRLSGVRQSSRPSPTPTPDAPADDQVASEQVSRLISAPHPTPAGDLVAAGGDAAITVTNEPGDDGSAIRVVSARYDLTASGSLLRAADTGHPIGGARCTQNLLVDGKAQVRTGMMLCWRAEAGRSVVTIATLPDGRPAAASSAEVLTRAWQNLG